MNALSLLQRHTIEIYALQGRPCTVERVPARELLSVLRFDLFAKLYYIRHRSADPDEAMAVYSGHIRAFNPDLREPGRSDKTTLEAFVGTFNQLIDAFANGDFDETLSLIPIGEGNVILDGAHRIAALASRGKSVTIARFPGVRAHHFTYEYFMKRGLSFALCDKIAEEMTHWMADLKAVCLWPSVRQKGKAVEALAAKYPVGYLRPVKMGFTAMVDFVVEIYGHQPWTREPLAVRDKASHCCGRSGEMMLLLIDAPYGDELMETKEEIRAMYGIGNHSLHITDTQGETIQAAHRAFAIRSAHASVHELLYRLRYIHWLRLKIALARMLRHKRQAI